MAKAWYVTAKTLNLHKCKPEEVGALTTEAARVLNAGGKVTWLQSGTLNINGVVGQDFKVTGVTMLTAIMEEQK